MHTLSYYIGISKQSEVLFLVLAGICCTIFDASLFNLHTNLYKVWNVPMDSRKFTDTAQLYVKYILSSIVLVRTFTVHLYLAFYIVMLWPAIFEEKACLMIPWLIVGAVKCLAMGAMSFSTGLYICLSYSFTKATCWDFLLAQIIDQAPSIYVWFSVMSYYYELKRKVPEPVHRVVRQTPSTVFSLAERRRRVRGLFADIKLENTFDDNRKLISVSTIDNIINQLNMNLNRDNSRSLDSLLSRMAAEAEKEEILSIKDEIGEDENGATFAERALKVLNISPSYVNNAKSKSKTFANLRPSNREKNLKVHSSPLLLLKKSLPDFRNKYKKIPEKLSPKKSGDELSLILSETELSTVGLSENYSEVASTSTEKTQLTQVLIREHFEDEESLIAEEFMATPQNDTISQGTKELSIQLADPDQTAICERKIIIQNLDSETSRDSTRDIQKSTSSRIKQKGSKIPCKISSVKLNKQDCNKECVETPTVKKDKENIEKNGKGKTEQRPMSASWSSSKSRQSNAKNLKSKSQAISNNIGMSTPTFKYDGYTLAYIESLQRKAATDLIKNKGRPRTSGT